MVTESNLETIENAQGEWGFLVGMTRRQNPEAETLIDQVVQEKWIDCEVGINAQETKQQDRPRTRVQEVQCDREGVRVFVVDSDERRAYEQRMPKKAMQHVYEGLKKVQTRVAKGRLKKPEKIGAAVERVLPTSSRLPLLRLAVERWPVAFHRTSHQLATRAEIRRQVPNSYRPAKLHPPGSGGPLQRTQRSGTRLLFIERSHRNATDLAPGRAAGQGTHIRCGIGVLVRSDVRASTERCRCAAFVVGRMVCAANHPSRRFQHPRSASHRRDTGQFTGPPSARRPQPQPPASPNATQGRFHHNVVTNSKLGPCYIRTYERTC